MVEKLVAISTPPLRALAPDRPGWGSASEAAGGIASNARWLEAALVATLGSEPVVLAGHSFGGGVVTRLALDHPARVRALVLVSPVGRVEAVSRLDRALALPLLGEQMVRSGLHAARGVARVALRRIEGSDRHANVSELTLLRQLTGEEPISDAAVRSFLVEQRAFVDETPALSMALPSLRAPAVVVAGTGDHIVPLEASRALAAAIPGAELVTVKGAGHLLPIEWPSLVADTIIRYVRLTA